MNRKWNQYLYYGNTTTLFLGVEREDMKNFGLWSLFIKCHSQLQNYTSNPNQKKDGLKIRKISTKMILVYLYPPIKESLFSWWAWNLSSHPNLLSTILSKFKKNIILFSLSLTHHTHTHQRTHSIKPSISDFRAHLFINIKPWMEHFPFEMMLVLINCISHIGHWWTVSAQMEWLTFICKRWCSSILA